MSKCDEQAGVMCCGSCPFLRTRPDDYQHRSCLLDLDVRLTIKQAAETECVASTAKLLSAPCVDVFGPTLLSRRLRQERNLEVQRAAKDGLEKLQREDAVAVMVERLTPVVVGVDPDVVREAIESMLGDPNELESE